MSKPHKNTFFSSKFKNRMKSSMITVDSQILAALGEMGFSINASMRAAHETENRGLEEAAEWIVCHIGDPELNLPFVPQLSSSSPTTTSEKDVSYLMEMGFERDVCAQALDQNSDLRSAIDFLLRNEKKNSKTSIKDRLHTKTNRSRFEPTTKIYQPAKIYLPSTSKANNRSERPSTSSLSSPSNKGVPKVVQAMLRKNKNLRLTTEIHKPAGTEKQKKKRHQSPSSSVAKRRKITKTFFSKHRSIIEQFKTDENLKMTTDDLIHELSETFKPFYVEEKSRWVNLQEKIPVSRRKLKQLIRLINTGGITDKIDKTVADVNNEGKMFFYIGIVSRELKGRLYDHLQLHKTVQGKTIAVFDDFAEAAMAEFTGIAYMRTISNSGDIKGSWNKSEGFDSMSIINAAKTAKRFYIYMLLVRPQFIVTFVCHFLAGANFRHCETYKYLTADKIPDSLC
jgi:hypothetical protein